MLTVKMYKTIVDNMFEGVYVVDLDRRIVYWNRGAERITGYSAAEVLGNHCAENLLVHVNSEGRCICSTSCPFAEIIQQNCDHRDDQLFLHHKDGHRVAVSVSISMIRDDCGTPMGAVQIFSESLGSERYAQLIENLKRETLLDLLTGLPNRRYLQMNLSGSLAEFERHGIVFGLLFVDVDHFKDVNDTYGHDVGDKVLKLVGNTMENCMRAYDMVGRWGGEEFLAIIRFTDAGQLEKVAEKFRVMVENSFLLHENSLLKVTITLGATVARWGDTMETLVKRADTLMYEGKQAGRNRVQIG